MFVIALALVLTAAPNSGPRGIVTARALIDEFQFAQALTVIAQTLREPDLDTATLISLYELEGIAHATNGAAAAAKESFARLLTLDPAHPIPGELPPKIRTLYFGARTVAQREVLELVAEVPTRTSGRIESVAVTVKTSSLVAVTGVRFSVSVDDGPPSVTVLPLDGLRKPDVKVGGAHVRWSAELLGAHDAVLRRVERDEVPPVEALVKTAVVAPAPPLPSSSSWVRPAGIAVGGGGLVGIGVGAALGVQARDARAKIAQAETNAEGVVVGLSQAEAARLDASARSSAVAANVLMIAGGALSATALLMLLLGPAEPAAVSLGVGPAGLTASGRF